jgi:hypothetical protein
MTLIINIPPELESRLQQEASLNGVALDEYARILLEKTLAPINSGSRRIPKGDAWAVLELMEGTVEGPPDWSSELDHYLYGTPKRSESTP